MSRLDLWVTQLIKQQLKPAVPFTVDQKKWSLSLFLQKAQLPLPPWQTEVCFSHWAIFIKYNIFSVWQIPYITPLQKFWNIPLSYWQYTRQFFFHPSSLIKQNFGAVLVETYTFRMLYIPAQCVEALRQTHEQVWKVQVHCMMLNKDWFSFFLLSGVSWFRSTDFAQIVSLRKFPDLQHLNFNV